MASRRRLIFLLTGLGIGSSLFAPISLAQLPTPELHGVFPPGGQQGQTVEVTVYGANLEGVDRLEFSHPGITASRKPGPRNELLGRDASVPNAFLVTIAGNAPAGCYEAKTLGYYGASNARLFSVGNHPESIENGANNAAASAQELPLNTVVNGRSDGASSDFYRVSLRAGERILVDCAAKRIDSPMDPLLAIRNADGFEFARSHDDHDVDPSLDFVAPADGDYVIEVQDLLFAGSAQHFYRLLVHAGPQIDQVFPPVLVAGQRNDVLLIGRNLPGGEPLDDGLALRGMPLQQLRLTIEAPPLSTHAAADWLDPAPLATALLDGFTYRWRADVPPIRLGLTRDPVVTESEPNDRPSQATKVTIPCEAVGRFYGDADQDWYQFQATAGEVIWIEVISHRLGLPADPMMIVQRITQNEQGEEQSHELAYLDDPADRPGRIGGDFDFSTDDPIFRFVAPEEGLYRVLVKDNFNVGASDPRIVYRLQFRRESPDFCLLVQPLQIKVPDNQVLLYSPVLRRGDTIVAQVSVERRDGFAGDIALVAENLPEGVRCDGAIIRAAANSAWISFTAADNAAVGLANVAIVGRGEHDGKRIRRYAASGAVVSGSGNKLAAAAVYRASPFQVSVIEPLAPALITAGDGAILETSKGGSIQVPIGVQRRGEFQQPLVLNAVGLPNELRPAEFTINGDQDSGALTLAATNAAAAPGVYAFYLRSDVTHKFSRHPESLQAALADQQQIGTLLAQAQEQAQQAQQTREALANQVDPSPEAIAAAEKIEQEGQARLQQLTEAKAAQDKLVEETQAAVAPKDLGIALVSPVMLLRLTPTPLSFRDPPSEISMIAGQPTELQVAVGKRYGFDEPVEVSLETPPDSPISSEKITLAVGQSAGALMIRCQPQATGDHAFTLKASAKFNGVDVAATTSLRLHVAPPPPQP